MLDTEFEKCKRFFELGVKFGTKLKTKEVEKCSLNVKSVDVEKQSQEADVLTARK